MQKNFLPDLLLKWPKNWRQVHVKISFAYIAIALSCFAAGLLCYLFFLQIQINSLQLEKRHWAALLTSEVKPLLGSEIPSYSKLPSIIDLCQKSLARNSIEVTSFNVESFAEKGETDSIPDLDYASIRIHFLGKWRDAETGINELEHLNNLAIHIQEIALSPAGGETLLRIYFLNN
ncbi:MAG TPA: hypothetical protein VN374_06510 [Desulfitobacteriaceae bacterium]|nr:hypothetical protein [Desulfitobacteriaceae bacterium]